MMKECTGAAAKQVHDGLNAEEQAVARAMTKKVSDG